MVGRFVFLGCCYCGCVVWCCCCVGWWCVWWLLGWGWCFCCYVFCCYGWRDWRCCLFLWDWCFGCDWVCLVLCRVLCFCWLCSWLFLLNCCCGLGYCWLGCLVDVLLIYVVMVLLVLVVRLCVFVCEFGWMVLWFCVLGWLGCFFLLVCCGCCGWRWGIGWGLCLCFRCCGLCFWLFFVCFLVVILVIGVGVLVGCVGCGRYWLILICVCVCFVWCFWLFGWRCDIFWLFYLVFLVLVVGVCCVFGWIGGWWLLGVWVVGWVGGWRFRWWWWRVGWCWGISWVCFRFVGYVRDVDIVVLLVSFCWGLVCVFRVVMVGGYVGGFWCLVLVLFVFVVGRFLCMVSVVCWVGWCCLVFSVGWKFWWWLCVIFCW